MNARRDWRFISSAYSIASGVVSRNVFRFPPRFGLAAAHGGSPSLAPVRTCRPEGPAKWGFRETTTQRTFCQNAYRSVKEVVPVH
jgi:hypothetical protein